MGVLTQQGIARQLAKGQGETNDRLDAIAARLDRLIAVMERSAPAAAGQSGAWAPPGR